MNRSDPKPLLSSEQYLGAVARALAVFLRPFRGQLGHEWLGIDRDESPFLILQSDAGISATWPVRAVREGSNIRHDSRGGRTLEGKYPNGPGKRTTANIDVVMTSVRGNPNGRLSVTFDNRLLYDLTADDAALAMLRPIFGSGYPPWILGLMSASKDSSRLLIGFDEDPILFAKGVSDVILGLAGLGNREPSKLYSDTAEALKKALASASYDNERALQSLLERFHWIIAPIADVTRYWYRPRLPTKETIASGAIVDGHIVPDFVFALHDDECLVVEIESSTKRLLLQDTASGVRPAAAPTQHALHQIDSYKRVLDGPTGREARSFLELPDSTVFKYLLVVGNRPGPPDTQRDWSALRAHHARAGIEVRSWDYYVDKLERLARASQFSPM